MKEPPLASAESTRQARENQARQAGTKRASSAAAGAAQRPPAPGGQPSGTRAQQERPLRQAAEAAGSKGGAARAAATTPAGRAAALNHSNNSASAWGTGSSQKRVRRAGGAKGQIKQAHGRGTHGTKQAAAGRRQGGPEGGQGSCTASGHVKPGGGGAQAAHEEAASVGPRGEEGVCGG